MNSQLSLLGRCCGVILIIATALALYGCNDTNTAPPPAAGPGALTIATGSLPSGSLNIPYNATLAPSGGNPPYSWSLFSGSLPNGLTLSSSGNISGTPTTIQTTSPTFRLQDSTTPTPQAVTKQLPMTITAVSQPAITTPSPLPNGIVNQPYPSTTLTAVGGTGALTWSAVVTPALPAGLTFNAATHTISGTPTATESNVTHTFSVTDSFFPTPQTVSAGLALTVSPAPLTLTITTSSPLPGGTVTQAYGPVQLAASGGTPPLTWDLAPGSPALPNGLQLSSGGVLSGTPSTAVNVTPVFRVRDSATTPQQTATKPLAISIVLPGPPNITTTSLPNGSFNNSYNQTVNVSGGIAPLTWGVIAGGLPTGLSLNSSNGVISGTATAAGTFNFTVRVTDAIPQFDDQQLSIIITAPPPPSITAPASLPTGTVNVAYGPVTLTASGGAPPLTFQPVGMPFGLTFTAATATISGTPTSSGGPTNVTFTVNDSTAPFNQTGTRTYSLTVNAALTIGTSSLPGGTVGTAYTAPALTASGGTPPYTWSITGTGAPNSAAPGVTLSSGGAFSGTPTTAGSFTRTYRVQDNNGVPATTSLTITIVAAPSGNNNLSALVVSAGALAPGFNAVIIIYTVAAPNATTSTTVTATVADSTASLTINGTAATSGVPSASIPLVVGPNSISIVVTAQDLTTKTYTVTITRAP